MLRWTLAVAALMAIALALWQIMSATTGLSVVRLHIDTIPVTVYQPQGAKLAPVVVISHGFAGSQQMMQPFAVTLARNGYITVTFDFPGHARNTAPLPGGMSDPEASGRALLAALDQVVSFARGLPESDGRIALLGHSMASDIVVRYAQAHPATAATVAVSLFSRDITASSPRNLLIIDGALEPAFLRDEAYRLVGMAAGGQASERVTYGNFAEGTARRLALAAGAEHISVLYNRDSMAETLAWLNEATGRSGSGFLDRRGAWLGLLYLGIVVLGWPLSFLLPQVAAAPLGIALGWPRLLTVAAIPALLTPMILWKLPTDFLPILLGDYLALHFATYGLLTFAAHRLLATPRSDVVTITVDYRKFALAAVASAIYCLAAIAVPTDWFVTSYWPTPARLPLALGMLCGTLPYFATDECLTRSARPRRGAYLVTKLFFLASLLMAVGLNFQKLFFLIIIVPAILLCFIVYGLFSTWIYRRTNHPLVGALAASIAIAWGIAVTFPIVGR
jgi:pimeloyl-ACP methyl ester carboxylesterase